MANRVNSRQKGARIEREAAKYLTSLGFPSERNARNGISTSDLVTPFKRVHVEVKGNEGMDVGTKLLMDAMQQATDGPLYRQPTVLWKRNRSGWRLTFWTIVPVQNQMTMGVPTTIAGDDDIRAVLNWLEGGRKEQGNGPGL